MNAIVQGALTRSEQARRYLIAASLIGLLMLNPTLPAWISLLALYPFATALVKWDPLNAVLEAIAAMAQRHRVGMPGMGGLTAKLALARK